MARIGRFGVGAELSQSNETNTNPTADQMNKYDITPEQPRISHFAVGVDCGDMVLF